MGKIVNKELSAYFAKIGSRGGKKRAKNHSKKQIRAWGILGGQNHKFDKKSK